SFWASPVPTRRQFSPATERVLCLLECQRRRAGWCLFQSECPVPGIAEWMYFHLMESHAQQSVVIATVPFAGGCGMGDNELHGVGASGVFYNQRAGLRAFAKAEVIASGARRHLQLSSRVECKGWRRELQLETLRKRLSEVERHFNRCRPGSPVFCYR